MEAERSWLSTFAAACARGARSKRRHAWWAPSTLQFSPEPREVKGAERSGGRRDYPLNSMLMMTPESAINDAWLVWVVSWVAAAFWSDRAAKRPGFGAEALYRGVMFVGIVLLFGIDLPRDLFRLWTVNDGAGWALAAAAVLGFLFCWWARLHLGRLWSGWVTKKAGHRIVETGPYRLVRHPIYTGLLTAAFATAAVKGTAVALAGAAAMTVSCWIKARLEEKFLSAELGAEAYAAYRSRTPMLIPFV